MWDLIEFANNVDINGPPLFVSDLVLLINFKEAIADMLVKLMNLINVDIKSIIIFHVDPFEVLMGKE